MKIGAPEDVLSLLNLVLAPVVVLSVCGMLSGSLWTRFHTLSARLRTLTDEQETLAQEHMHGDDLGAGPAKRIAQEVPDLLVRSRLELAAIRSVITAMIILIGDMFVMAIISFIQARWALWLAVLLFLCSLGMLCRSLLLVVREISIAQQGLVGAGHQTQKFTKMNLVMKGRFVMSDANATIHQEIDANKETLSKYWWMIALIGVLTLLFGIAMTVWAHLTLHVMLVLFGLYTLVFGVTGLVTAFATMRQHENWLLYGVAGMTSLLVGIVTFTWPKATGLLLLFLIAFSLILTGVLQAAAGYYFRANLHYAWLLVGAGVLEALLGLFMILRPMSGALLFARVIGLFTILSGALYLAFAFLARHWRQPLAFEQRPAQPAIDEMQA